MARDAVVSGWGVEDGEMSEFPLYPNDDDDREQAELDARHLWAVKVLDAWAKKHDEATAPHPIFHQYMSKVDGARLDTWTISYSVRSGLQVERHPSAMKARVSAAVALVMDDPSLTAML